MPKMTLTEDEASLIRKDREVRALQKVAWNEALAAVAALMYPDETHEANELLRRISALTR